ncbi:MAG TPA: hypothetical protein GXX75_05070 [Clostridiales bacterium]|nr:hypothetical protein [Clostridiales bacterium]
MNVKAIFFDLDGTLYFKGNAIKGAVETVDYLKSKGYICRFLTNTDSKQTSEILDRVTHMGFHISLDEIFTPVTASVKFLERKKMPQYILLLFRAFARSAASDILQERILHSMPKTSRYISIFFCPIA